MIFPKPQFLKFSDEKYSLKENYNECTVIQLYNRIKGGNEISVKNEPFFEKEEYKITVGKEGVTIFTSCDEGIFRASSTLIQLIDTESGTTPFCEIKDKPQLERRGYMLDIDQDGRIPTVKTIKQIIDYLASLKYNEFQLYLEGAAFRYREFSQISECSDRLDEEDILEIGRYCKERFIDFVPNQNSLGHLSVWLNQKDFFHLGLRGDDEKTTTINPLLPESEEFIGRLYNSLLPLFDSKYVNIGCDEAFELGKFQTEEYCKKHGKGKLFMEWLNKLNALAGQKYGKKIMFWSDMIYSHKELYNMIPKDATVLEWGYDLIQSQMMTEHCIEFNERKIDYYVCPSCNTHRSFTGRFDVTSFNIRTGGELAAKYGAKGMLLTEWGCDEGVWSAVPCALAAQYSWNPGENQDGETLKAQFIRDAESYADTYLFKASGVSRLIYRLANYYLLEPERIHCGTICGRTIKLPLNEMICDKFLDLKACGDDFYFDNVIYYVNKILADVEKIDFDETLKREIVLNSKAVILAAELVKVRLHQTADEKTKENISMLIDEIIPEYTELWNIRNLKSGSNRFTDMLLARKSELMSL